MGMAFSVEIESFGITLPMWRVLAQLWHEKVQRQNDIADRTSMEPATLSRLLKSMEAMDLIIRTRSIENAREVGVALTPKGRALTNKIIPIALRSEALAIGDIPKERIELVRDVLIELFGNIAAYYNSVVPPSRRLSRLDTLLAPNSIKHAKPAKQTQRTRLKRVR